MKNFVKILSSGVLIAGIAGVATAQTFVAMRVNIQGSVNGSFPADAVITDITATYDSQFFGNPFQNLVQGPGAPNTFGFTYIEQTGNLTFNLANYGTGLSFNPSQFTTTFQYDVNIDDSDLATPQQSLTTGPYPIPGTTVSGQPAPILMGTLAYDDTPGGVLVGVDPTAPDYSGGIPPADPPSINGNEIIFTTGGGAATTGAMANSGGGALGGGESMTVTTAANGGPININGSDVAMVVEIDGCTNPPYTIVLNVPAAVYATVSPIAIAHNNAFVTIISDDDNGGDHQLKFELASCSPVFVQDGNDAPLAIELERFEATATSNSVTLNWATASETNNEGFIIERKTSESEYLEVASWERDKELVGAGNSTHTTEYSFTDRAVKANTSYVYRLSDVDVEGKVTAHNQTVEVVTEAKTIEVPERYYLAQNHPNPFNPSTSIEFGVKEEGKVTLEIYNVKGQLINTLANTDFQAGNHSVVWNGTDSANKAVSSGIYFYKLSVNDYSEVKKMTFLK